MPRPCAQLEEQRRPRQLQKAFADALKHATAPSPDLEIITLLLDSGASPADLHCASLFDLDDLSLNDAFGFCSEIYKDTKPFQKAPDTRTSSLSSSFRASASAPGEASISMKSSLRKQSSAGQGAQPAGSAKSTARSGAQHPTAMDRTSTAKLWNALLTPLRGMSRKRHAKQSEASTDEKLKEHSQWQEVHIKKIKVLVRGFEAYAPQQLAMSLFDLVLWATFCGAMPLAQRLWERPECRSPLRASLLVQHMCAFIRETQKKEVRMLEEAEKKFSELAKSLLDNLPDQETARKLLRTEKGDKAVLGASGKRRLSILDLALELRNVQFIAHRYCQGILDDMWSGRAPKCGRLQLARATSNWAILLQIPASLVGVCVLHVEPNDLYPWDPATDIQQGKDGKDKVTVSAWQSLVAVWQIPLVKRQVPPPKAARGLGP